jgi:hypothetical protein
MSVIVKANTTHVLYPQINAPDPSTAISNSEGSTASTVIPLTELDKLTFRLYLSEYNYNTGDLTHGIQLGTDTLSIVIKTADDLTVLGSWSNFGETNELAALPQIYYLTFSKDVKNLVGKHFAIGRRVASAVGHLREAEKVEAFWFQDTGGTETTAAPFLSYDSEKIPVNSTTAPTNLADYPSSKAAAVLATQTGWGETHTNHAITVTCSTAGAVTHTPTSSDTANIGINVQQYGVDGVYYQEAVVDLSGGSAAAVATALGSADSITAKLSIKINKSSGSLVKTIATQDIVIHRNFNN